VSPEANAVIGAGVGAGLGAALGAIVGAFLVWLATARLWVQR